ncbi:MAG: DR2241 family protein [Limisphaerales bacterium]
MENPALQHFLSELKNELVFAQVLIRRHTAQFELRHLHDKNSPAEKLRLISLDKIRELAQHTSAGAFRPLKSAPNLSAGWRLLLTDDPSLELALNQLYPGALADWWAAKSVPPPVTKYRPFTNCQTGMYRITQRLDDDAATAMIRACCHKKFCLKQRLWTVGELAADRIAEKSLISCLEPCAILLEFARKTARLEQETKIDRAVPSGEKAGLENAVKNISENPNSQTREADFNSPLNPRRAQWLLEKLALVRASSHDEK